MHRIAQLTLTAEEADVPMVRLEVEYVPPFEPAVMLLDAAPTAPGDQALLNAVTAMLIGFNGVVRDDEEEM